MCCPAAPRLCHHLAPRWAVPLAASSTPHIAERRFSCGALPGLAYATVVFFVAAFLLVLVAFVSLALALTVPSGPSLSGLHRRLARTIVLGLLLLFSLCLAPYHLLLAPPHGRAGGRHWRRPGSYPAASSTLNILPTLSLALLSLNSCLDALVCYCLCVRCVR